MIREFLEFLEAELVVEPIIKIVQKIMKSMHKFGFVKFRIIAMLFEPEKKGYAVAEW